MEEVLETEFKCEDRTKKEAFCTIFAAIFFLGCPP